MGSAIWQTLYFYQNRKLLVISCKKAKAVFAYQMEAQEGELLMEGLKEQVGKAVKEIDDVVEMFYQQKTQEAYLQLDPVLGRLMDTLTSVITYAQEHPEAGIDVESLTEALKEALSAVEERDAILMADVLKYEVIEKLEDIAGKLD